VLAVDDSDAGCGLTRTVLERYVETELAGHRAGARFPGVALHLTMCPACRADHDGLLALTRASSHREPRR
jgi:predicted anti-sigma-YlaC factor YlaD